MMHIRFPGFFDKTGSSSSKKRSYDQRNETPGSAKSDVRDETPGGRVTRRCRHFGRIAMQSSGSPRRGYQSTDGTIVKMVVNVLEQEYKWMRII